MQWSDYSKAIFEHFETSKNNLIVQACPGAGKTTNVMELWNRCKGSAVYLVFAKANQVEAEAKLAKREGCQVKTLNGLGHSIVMNNYGQVKLDSRKVFNIIKNEIKVGGKRLPFDQSGMLAKVVSYAKGLDDEELDDGAIDRIIDTYDLDMYEGMHDHVRRVIEINDGMVNVIDFDDQIRFPAIHDLHMPSFDDVLGDEVQDFSPVQARMIAKLNAKRYTLVGDKHQSIYGFRGAMNNSMEFLKKSFRCDELPLSITYRCAKDIVEVARGIFKDIEAWENSPKGVVRYAGEKEKYKDSDLLVCRFNQPLITKALALLREGQACYVKGRDIGEGLIKLIERQGCNDVRGLVKSLQLWKEEEDYKASLKDDDAKLRRTQDKYDSIMVFVEKRHLDDSVDSLVDLINSVFKQGHGVCLSTVHKAKGLEAERVFIVDKNRIRARAKLPWQVEQEANVEYVAVTRAKGELVYS